MLKAKTFLVFLFEITRAVRENHPILLSLGFIAHENPWGHGGKEVSSCVEKWYEELGRWPLPVTPQETIDEIHDMILTDWEMQQYTATHWVELYIELDIPWDESTTKSKWPYLSLRWWKIDLAQHFKRQSGHFLRYPKIFLQQFLKMDTFASTTHNQRWKCSPQFSTLSSS